MLKYQGELGDEPTRQGYLDALASTQAGYDTTYAASIADFELDVVRGLSQGLSES